MLTGFLIVVILGLQSYVIAAQVPTKEELWHRYDSALSADIEEWKQAVILSSLDSIRNCLRMPYSSQRVGFYLNEVDTLYMNPDLQEPEREILDTLRLLIENYQEETAKFIDIFSGQIIDSTTITLLSNLLFKGVGSHPKTGKKKGGIKVHTSYMPTKEFLQI